MKKKLKKKKLKKKLGKGLGILIIFIIGVVIGGQIFPKTKTIEVPTETGDYCYSIDYKEKYFDLSNCVSEQTRRETNNLLTFMARTDECGFDDVEQMSINIDNSFNYIRDRCGVE